MAASPVVIHAINMLNRISKTSKKLNTTQTSLYNWIETKKVFNRAEISKQAQLLGLKDRTLSDILKRFIKLELIEKVSHGVYKKR